MQSGRQRKSTHSGEDIPQVDGPMDGKEKTHHKRKKSGQSSTSKSTDQPRKQLSSKKSEEKPTQPVPESKETEPAKPKSGKGIVQQIPQPDTNPIQ